LQSAPLTACISSTRTSPRTIGARLEAGSTGADLIRDRQDGDADVQYLVGIPAGWVIVPAEGKITAISSRIEPLLAEKRPIPGLVMTTMFAEGAPDVEVRFRSPNRKFRLTTTTSKQVVDYLLGSSCEDLFNKNGERWMLKQVWNGKRFPLLDRLNVAHPYYFCRDVLVFSGSAVGIDADSLGGQTAGIATQLGPTL